jgi:hypothetical protein
MYLSMRGLEVGWWGRVTMEEGWVWEVKGEGERVGEMGKGEWGREGVKVAKDYLVIN